MKDNFKKAFTLIELLIVIGIMAVIAAGVVALIDPVEKTRQANDANIQSGIGQIAGALQSYAAQQTDGSYPQPGATVTTRLDPLVTAGELKALPKLPANYGEYFYTVDAVPATSVTAAARLFSKKYLSKCAAGVAYWIFSSGQGQACGFCGVAATAPAAGSACAAW